jgi:succinate dehydrogenase/fumarate reductase flavoprotein subunit
VVTQTLEELADEMRELGVYGEGVLATLREFNAAAEAGQAAHLRIPRRDKANPVVKPPFYALCVTPGVTFTLGGLRIDTDARVLDRRGLPIDSLYAAGADGGGVYNEQYGGSLCLGLVFGRRAGQHAAALTAAG